MLVRVLGPVEVRSASERTWLRPPRQQRIVLALLASQPGRARRADALVRAVWGDAPPQNAPRLLQGLVSRLRAALEPPALRGARLPTTPSGWRLDVDEDMIDAFRFERLVRAARRRAHHDGAAGARSQLREALGLWRGRPFGELADRPSLRGESARLEEHRLGAHELLLGCRLAAGELAEVTAELQQLVVEHPLHERLWALLLEALYRSGRHAEALAGYQELRSRLIAELGTEPGPGLQQLHGAMLRHEALGEPGLAAGRSPPAP